MVRRRDDERDGRDNRGLDNPEVIPTDRIEGSSLERITRSEIDIQIATAHRFPRSVAKFKQDALSMATLDEDTASACFYVLPRGGKKIEGPSVRLAEIVAGCWGNLRAETRIIEEGDRFVTAQAMCIDLERNVAIRTEVQRRITDKNGTRYGDDMIMTTANAASSIALRNAVFRVVPMAYVKPVYEQAKLVAIGDVKTLGDRRARAIEWFGKLGVVESRVLAALGKKSVEDVDLEDLETMQGMRTSIQDGQATVEETFPPPMMAEGTVKVGKNGEATAKPAATATKSNPDEFPYDAPEKSAPPDGSESPNGEKKPDGKTQAEREAEFKKAHARREPGED